MKRIAHVWSNWFRVEDDMRDYGDRGYKIDSSNMKGEMGGDYIYFVNRTFMNRMMRGIIFDLICFADFEPTDAELGFAKSRVNPNRESE